MDCCVFLSMPVRVHTKCVHVRREALVRGCLGHQCKKVEVNAKVAFIACACKHAIMNVCAWTSGRRVLEGPVVCVNPLKASGSLLLWRFQWISATQLREDRFFFSV